jgi:murein DD-endopeptidase MepM/ murein hydrolase activator NlpD
MMILATLSALAAVSGHPLDVMHIRGNSIKHTFGMVRNSGTRAHQGWDFEAKIGTPVYAIAPFKLMEFGIHKDYGYWLQYRSERSGYYYFYAHLSEIENVSKGKPGTLIGYTGNSGNAKDTTPHLHFEMRTVSRPGLGLNGRVSPANTFGSWKQFTTLGVNKE